MGKMHREGVTLIELLVTLSVVAIIVAIGVPSLRDFFATNHMSAAANDLVTSLHMARSEAVKRETLTRICPSANWDQPVPDCTDAGDLSDGWIIVVDPNGDAVVVQAHEPLPGGIRLEHDFVDTIDFMADGRPGDGAVEREFNILLCDDRGDRDMGGGIAAGRWINVRGTGRPKIYRRLDEVQAMLGGC